MHIACLNLLFQRNYLYDYTIVVLVGGITIKTATINVADEKDLAFVEGLQSLGRKEKCGLVDNISQGCEGGNRPRDRKGHGLEAAGSKHCHENSEGAGLDRKA